MNIPISTESTRFSDFLKDKDNVKIIFSGIYGIGKTYFIHKFFEDSDKKYTPIFLSPVRYSVASNKDIFEYIKVDILIRLLESGVVFEKTDISSFSAANYFLINYPIETLKNVLTIADQICAGADHLSGLFSFFDKLKKYRANLSKDDQDESKKYISEQLSEVGSVFEFDGISTIIKICVDKLKDEGKIPVLVIDDLDRIDPEHIFRVLNVLSVHEDYLNESENKFGFSKTILVCDIVNIRKIFSSKYGSDVDFNGYIDKFYSREVFKFDNTKEIIVQAANTILSINSDNNSWYKMSEDKYPTKVCIAILEALLRNGSVNIRSLIKLSGNTMTYRRSYFLNGRENPTYYVPGLMFMELFRSLFSSDEDMKKAFENIDILDADVTYYVLLYLLPLADFGQNNFETRKLFKYIDSGLAFDYKLIKYTDDNMLVMDTDDMQSIIENNGIGLSSKIVRAAYHNYSLMKFTNS